MADLAIDEALTRTANTCAQDNCRLRAEIGMLQQKLAESEQKLAHSENLCYLEEESVSTHHSHREWALQAESQAWDHHSRSEERERITAQEVVRIERALNDETAVALGA